MLRKIIDKMKGNIESALDSAYRDQIDMVDELAKLLSQNKPKNLIDLIRKSAVSPDPETSSHTACKAIVLYIECNVKRLFNGDFSGFISLLHNFSAINPLTFRLLKTKDDLVDIIGGNAYDLIEIKDFDSYVKYFSDNNVIGELRIRTDGKKGAPDATYHSITTYRDLDRGIPAISDTTYGGIRAHYSKRANKDNFEYVSFIG